jgi:2-alkyl-3-oxoalkanoate reductase
MGTVHVITGATGLLGSHTADQLCRRGVPVRALVRRNSDTRFLQTLPIELVVADLENLAATPRALADAGTVYHCAALVRDWGTWDEYYRGTVELTRCMVDACRDAGAGRFVYVSSISVFGNPPPSAGTITESDPIGKHLWTGDHYGRSKVLAEEVVRDYSDHTIVRPSWLYGRRDLVSIPRLVEAVRSRKARIIGSGDNLLNLLSADDAARGIVLAAESPDASGQAYNLCSPGEISQRELFDLLSHELGMPPIRRRVPFRVAWTAAFVAETLFRAVGSRRPPPFTRRALLMLSRPTRFSIDKARIELGWQPEIAARDGLREALASFLDRAAGTPAEGGALSDRRL